MRALPIRCFLMILSMLAAGSVQAAEECQLKLVSELDLLDTGAYWSGIVPSAAEGLTVKSLRYLGIGAVGARQQGASAGQRQGVSGGRSRAELVRSQPKIHPQSDGEVR